MPYFSKPFLPFLLILLSLALCLAATAATGATVFPYETATQLLVPEESAPATTPPVTSAASYALLDRDSGLLMAEKDAHTRRPMASTTKLMTALVALELLPWDQTVTVPREAVGIEGSSIYLFEGEQITVGTLLYGLMLSSANDAATALAICAAGSIEAFAARMNEKAATLGLTNTHFCNPHGLHHKDHYTTAFDLAQLTAAALKNETFAKIVATPRYSAPQMGTEASRLFLNHNRLLRGYEGAVGVKTGFTKTSGRCLVSAATREGLTLIAVTLNAPDDWHDHAALLDFGFSQYRAFCPTPMRFTLPVVGGNAPTVDLYCKETYRVTLPKSHAAITCTVEAPRFLFGGFTKEAVKGRVLYRMGDQLLFEAPLLTDAAVTAEKPSATWLARIKNLFGD